MLSLPSPSVVYGACILAASVMLTAETGGVVNEQELVIAPSPAPDDIAGTSMDFCDLTHPPVRKDQGGVMINFDRVRVAIVNTVIVKIDNHGICIEYVKMIPASPLKDNLLVGIQLL